MPKLREFTIDTAYLTDEVVREEWNMYTRDGRVPTAEELVLILAGEGKLSVTSSQDHPKFAELRDQLEQLGYIRTCRNSWNGDRVIKSFRLNGLIARRGHRFSCASALGNHFRVLQKHTKYHSGYLN